MTPEQRERKLIRFLNYLHVSVRLSDDEPRYYVQNARRIMQLDHGLPYGARFQEKLFQSLFHEIGHLLVAPRSRRDRPDYGIPANALGETYWDIEDEKATLVELELCRILCVEPRFSLGYGFCKATHEWWIKSGKRLTLQTWRESQAEFWLDPKKWSVRCVDSKK